MDSTSGRLSTSRISGEPFVLQHSLPASRRRYLQTDAIVGRRRNLENAVRHNKPMRGVDLSRTERLRILKCFEQHAASKVGVNEAPMLPR